MNRDANIRQPARDFLQHTAFGIACRWRFHEGGTYVRDPVFDFRHCSSAASYRPLQTCHLDLERLQRSAIACDLRARLQRLHDE